MRNTLVLSLSSPIANGTEAYVSIELLYILPTLVAVLFLLPLRIDVGVSKPESGSLTGYHLSTGFFAGLGGLRVQKRTDADRPYLYPEVFGIPLVFLGMRLPEKRPKSTETAPEKEISDSTQEKKKQKVASTYEKLRRIAFLLQKPSSCYLRQLRRIVGGLRIRADGRVGVEDPSQTGRIYGYANSLGALMGKRVRLQIVPNFTGPGVSGILDLRFRLHLGLMLFLTLLFAGRVGLRWLVWQLTGGSRRVGSLLPRRWRRWHRT